MIKKTERSLTSKSPAVSRRLLQLQEGNLDFITTSLYFDGIYLAMAISS